MNRLLLLCLLLFPSVVLAQNRPARGSVQPMATETGRTGRSGSVTLTTGSVGPRNRKVTRPSTVNTLPEAVQTLPEVVITGYGPQPRIDIISGDTRIPPYPPLPYIDRMRQRWKTEAARTKPFGG